MSDTANVQCDCSTTKKAWSNPLAPMARCSKKAIASIVQHGRVVHVCVAHQAKFKRTGYVSTHRCYVGEPAPAPSGGER
jgi:hypothetical protein